MKNLIGILALVMVAAFSFADKGEESVRTACAADYVYDIGPDMSQPDGSDQTVTFDCGAEAGCDSYFDIILMAGDVLNATFCEGVATADFDTGLGVWSGAPDFTTYEGCNDDTCGLLSELPTFTAPADGTYRVRVGGFATGAGIFTLQYNAPVGAQIIGALETTGVPTMSQWGLALMVVLMAVAAMGFIRKK